ncbi:hypothetical protein [Alkaliphilus hydrothermalis]|uniref:Helix-turn-helix type 11 domain-containing protein n=1 Tax=Alkaliphilus hydrothermalis TaxID=1482730 RepID=A0ABS2NRK8_9FIRM|nr:hypothetical protein [Alkaliphilus hydrothermalis]MBM7615604.1 hypothetical protein [Alkaliphilus hydrothermalis]
MPSIISMLEGFINSNYKYGCKKSRKLILGNEAYSLCVQEEILDILEKNVIKTTDKTMLSQQIAEAIEGSFGKISGFKDKAFAKELYMDLVEYLNEKYKFRINIDSIVENIIGTPEERCLYLLRETERTNFYGKKMGLTEIAAKLGCSRRVLEKDVQRITEQGFNLLGLNIKLVDERNSVLSMESTPHPIILMQNISQIMVMLEGLRAMENTKAYNNYARSTAINIWNQLTEYAQNKVLDAIEVLNKESDAIIEWYLNLRDESLAHKHFITEIKNSEGNISSQLMYLAKNQKPFNITYKDKDGLVQTRNDCWVIFFNPSSDILRVKTPYSEVELEEDQIIELDVL